MVSVLLTISAAVFKDELSYNSAILTDSALGTVGTR